MALYSQKMINYLQRNYIDRRDALKRMGFGLAAVAMAGIAPKTHAAILKDRAAGKKRLFSTLRLPATHSLLPDSFPTLR